MSTAILNQLLDDIAPNERASFKGMYHRIKELPSSASDLQDFLDEYLRQVVQLYAATAGAIWFCSPNDGQLGIKAHIGLDRLLRDQGRQAFVDESLVAEVGFEFAREV